MPTSNTMYRINAQSLSMFLVCMLTPPVLVYAHGDGTTFSATTTAEGGEMRVIDVDYSEPSISADSVGRFDFKLFTDTDRTKSVPFTDLWVRIEEKRGTGRGAVLFAGPIAKADLGGTGFTIVFPEAGEYTLSVRYNGTRDGSHDATLAEGEFSLSVLPGANAPGTYRTPAFWTGFISALIISLAAAGALFARSRFS